MEKVIILAILAILALLGSSTAKALLAEQLKKHLITYGIFLGSLLVIFAVIFPYVDKKFSEIDRQRNKEIYEAQLKLYAEENEYEWYHDQINKIVEFKNRI